MEIIKFYKQNEKPYGLFSNFSMYKITLDGKLWPSTEHYYQAKKFAGTEYEEEIRQLKTAAMAAKAGRAKDKPMREDWDKVKNTVMKDALWAKFTQNQTPQNVLLSTGDALLVEHTKNDAYWGDGSDGDEVGPGLNMLGKLLMEVRGELRERQVATTKIKRLLDSEPLKIEYEKSATPFYFWATTKKQKVARDTLSKQ
jgi:N-glycosidase YbiA